ncbi:MAG: type II secretion system F family protein, partial [Nanoarchaeota archaeon]|nr:type II secretion system F family protein [Nanoarchaeota archaeon]
KANIDVLFESYVAMIYLSVFLSAIISVFVMISLLFFDVSFVWPFFEFRTGEYLIRLSKIFWIPLAIPLLVFLGLYFYPSTEKKSIGKRIDQELPFAVIHMSAISGSGIEPSEIFRIIGLSKEYPYLRREIRKILNQINLYGYDLTTALNNSSKTAPSEKLSELLSGLSTTITSGANLSEFFEKRAESLLLSYRLERQKYTKLVETFLDIYISIVIAAPMIFLLLLIMMTISGINIGLGPFQISLLAVFIISLLNAVFLVFLQIRQPSY